MGSRARVRTRVDGVRFEELRGTRTLREIAAAAGLSESYVGQIELGVRHGYNPDIRHVLATALGVDVAEIETTAPPEEIAA